MDKNGRLFGKISIIDAFVILIAITIIAGTAYRFLAPATAVDSGNAVINYTLRIDGVRDFTAQYYQEGLPVFDRMVNQRIGQITGVRSEVQRAFMAMPNGEIVHAERPGILVVYVDIEANGRETETAYFAEGNYELRVGSTV
ncbi:MAG: DUF4330 domain-containing protein, partial [Defluviitaleaceae bacterium]|nr:DUF4330 domain-containing protein [Defluviitaleaceae bacterium]